MNDSKELKQLWSVFKLLMTILHSQSIVERGFSINADVVTPNLKDETLVSLRMVHDGMNAMGIDLSKSVVPKELLAHCKGARTRYEQHQADSEKKKHVAESSRKRKLVMEEIKEQKLKVRIEKNIESLEKEADSLSLEAEKKESFQTLSKANALRAKTKSVRAEQLTMVDKSLSDLEKELKSLVD